MAEGCNHEQIRIVGVTAVSFLPLPQVRESGETSVIRRFPPPVDNLVTVRMKPQWCPWCHGEEDHG